VRPDHTGLKEGIDEDGASVIRLDGEAVGRVLNGGGLRPEHVTLVRLDLNGAR
jgi:hypothetical protein